MTTTTATTTRTNDRSLSNSTSSSSLMSPKAATTSTAAASAGSAAWVLATSPPGATTTTTTTTTTRLLWQEPPMAAIMSPATRATTSVCQPCGVALMQQNFQQMDWRIIIDDIAAAPKIAPLVVTPPHQEVEWWKLGGTLPNKRTVETDADATIATTRRDKVVVVVANHHRWYLMEKLVGDVVIGCGVTFLVAPFLTVVDKAIVQKSAGTHTLLGSAAETTASIVRAPLAYIRSPMFLLMWGVYASTYSTANSLKTLVEHAQQFPSTTTESSSSSEGEGSSSSGSAATGSNYGKAAIFVGTTAVNGVSSMLKDSAYSRLFSSSSSTSAVPKSVPFMSYGMWASRDMLVISSSFLLPDLVSSRVREALPWLHPSTVHSVTQFLCPVATQVLAGPAHLAGLDWYNRPRATLWQRALFQYQNYGSVVWARIARVAPGYGIGGIGNSKCRDAWRDFAAQRHWQERCGCGYRNSVPTTLGQDRKVDCSRGTPLFH